MVTGCATTDTASTRFPELEENINAAKAAVVARDIVSANRFVDEAMVDSDYARALAPTEKAKQDALKLRESIQAMKQFGFNQE